MCIISEPMNRLSKNKISRAMKNTRNTVMAVLLRVKSFDGSICLPMALVIV
jgi:hypothetical protein